MKVRVGCCITFYVRFWVPVLAILAPFDPKSAPNGRGLPTPVCVARMAAPCVIFSKTGSPERLLSKSYRGEHGPLWDRCKKSTFQPCIGSILFKRIRAQGPVGSKFPPLGCPWVPGPGGRKFWSGAPCGGPCAAPPWSSGGWARAPGPVPEVGGRSRARVRVGAAPRPGGRWFDPRRWPPSPGGGPGWAGGRLPNRVSSVARFFGLSKFRLHLEKPRYDNSELNPV